MDRAIVPVSDLDNLPFSGELVLESLAASAKPNGDTCSVKQPQEDTARKPPRAAVWPAERLAAGGPSSGKRSDGHTGILRTGGKIGRIRGGVVDGRSPRGRMCPR